MRLITYLQFANSSYLENPIWSKVDNALYFIDIKKGSVYMHDLNLSRTYILHKFNEHIGGISLEKTGLVLVYGSNGRIYSINVRKNTVGNFMTIDNINTRFNEVFVLRDSTVLAGIMPSTYTTGKVLHIKSKREYEVIVDGLTTPNGFAYNGQDILITDTHKKKILRPVRKSLSKGGQYQTTIFCDLKNYMGFPDGLIEIDNMYISANNGSNSLTYISKVGDVIGSLYLGEFEPTSLCLAETKPRQLIVTTKANSKGVSNVLFICWESSAISQQYRSNLQLTND